MEIHMTTEHLLGFDIRHELEDIRPLDFLHNFVRQHGRHVFERQFLLIILRIP